jgi:hypothetical protein
VEVIIITGVKLTLTGDKSADDSKGTRTDVSFGVDFGKESWVLSTDTSEDVFGSNRLKFQQHCWLIKDGYASDHS